MLTAPMTTIKDRHDGRWQREASTYPRALDLTHKDMLWKRQRFRTKPMNPPLSLYNEGCRPRARSLNKSRDLAFRPDKEKDHSKRISGPISILNFEQETKFVDERRFKNVDADDPLSPRMLPLMEPLKPPSCTPILQPPATFKPSSLTTKETSSHRSSEVGSANLASDVPDTEAGPAPIPVPLRMVPSPNMLNVGSSTERRNSQLSMDNEWKKIKKLRMGTWSLRSKIHELRKVLRTKQLERSTADDRFLQYVRMRGLGVTLENQDISKQQKSITELLEDCQKPRDEYGPLEDDCNLLEDQLGRDEFELTKLEENFYNRQSDPETFQEVQHSPVSDSYEGSSYSESEVGQESHPLVSKFLSTLGDVDILQERLDYHIEEKFALEYQKESRLGVGLDLAQDDQEWLDNYEDLEANLLKEIDEATTEAEKLKQVCLEQGLVDEDGNPTDFEKQERHTFMEEAPEVYSGAERSEFVKFPVLLPRPGSKEVQFFDTGPKADEAPHSTGDHINQWLLHQLRSSPLDVNLLARTFEAEFGHIKGEEWQSDVLAFWYKDGARKTASEYRVYSSGTATQVPRRSRHSARSLSDTSERYSFGMAIRSSFLQARSRSNSESLESIESTQQFGLLLPPPIPGPRLSQSI